MKQRQQLTPVTSRAETIRSKIPHIHFSSDPSTLSFPPHVHSLVCFSSSSPIFHATAHRRRQPPRLPLPQQQQQQQQQRSPILILCSHARLRDSVEHRWEGGVQTELRKSARASRRGRRSSGVGGERRVGMAGRVVRSCVQTGLKTVNSVLGLAGMAVILDALWMLRAWYREVADLHYRLPVPWFIYTFIGLGIFMCLLTCSGHIAAETANSHCLSCYMIFVFIIIILEGAITTDVFLNSNWEEDFPDDPSGKFEEFKDFIRSNSDICEWIGLSVVAAQVLSIILGMVLRALGPDRESDYDSDDDSFVPARLPLLRNQSQHGINYSEHTLPQSSDSWSVRILDKANK